MPSTDFDHRWKEGGRAEGRRLLFRTFRTLSIYAAVAAISTVFFFFLHHIGNQISLDLAKLRFVHAIESGPWDDGVAHRFRSDFTYCQIAAATLADAAKKKDDLLLSVVQQHHYKSENDYCKGVAVVITGADEELSRRTLKTRYWWGNKALYAIALRFWSVPEIQDLIRTATYIAYAGLGLSLLALAPKTLLIISPLILLGMFFSGVPYFADAENGIPYLWTVLAATILVVLVGQPARRWASLRTVRVYCFLVGCVSSYVWLGDGHAFLAVTYIGLLAYFGSGRRDAVGRTGFGLACVSLYVIGFCTSYWLGQFVKMAVIGNDVWLNLVTGAIGTVEKTISGRRVLDIADLFRHFYVLVAGRNDGFDYIDIVGVIATCLVLLALAGATIFAAIRAYIRGQLALLWDVGFVLSLMLISAPQFMIADDIPFRTARFMFVLYGLCLSCLVLVLCGGVTTAGPGRGDHRSQERRPRWR